MRRHYYVDKPSSSSEVRVESRVKGNFRHLPACDAQADGLVGEAKSARRNSFKIRSFSLVELLVVVGIIAILMSILLPALVKARLRAGDIACQNNLKQSYTAFFNYSIDFNDWVPLGSNALRTTIPQYVGNLTYDYKSNLNRYTCRSLQCPHYRGYTPVAGYPYCFSYGQNDYVVGTLGMNRGKFSRVPRPSMKFLLADGADASTGKAPAIYSHTPQRFGFSLHSNGVNVLFCDGHVEWRHRGNIIYDAYDYFWNRFN